MTQMDEPADPARDHTTWRDFTEHPDGTQTSTPRPLAEVERAWQEIVDADGETRVKLRLENSDEEEGRDSPVIVITSDKAALLYSAMGELGRRLQPGFSAGPMQTSESLPRLLRFVERQLEMGI